MPLGLRGIFVLTVLELMIGCAGTKFVRQTDEGVVIGQTTYSEIVARLGKPYQNGILTKNTRQMKTMSYAFASALGDGDQEYVVPANSQVFYFYEDKLVGYEYASSWKADSTNFESDRISQIRINESTIEDIVSLFGEPRGKYSYPMIASEDGKAVNYFYTQVTSKFLSIKMLVKKLNITFDKNGKVIDYEFSESRQ